MKKTHNLPEGFEKPIELPAGADAQVAWQEQNRKWWEANPMRYDWNTPIEESQYSPTFFEEIDRRHFTDASRYTPPTLRPFDELIPFDSLTEMDVLEIGVGNGSHAQLIAPFCKSYTGIDITDYAVKSTTSRFNAFDIAGTIVQMDAEALTFPNNSFDFIWTWGVIHHSANTEQVLREMRRVLRPGGRAMVMVYHRSLLYYYVFSGLFRGIFCGGLFKTRSLHKLVQLSTDGAIARFYSKAEWRTLAERHFIVESICVKGQKSELFPLPAGAFKEFAMRCVPNSVSRFVLNTCGQGSFLISHLRKPH